MMHYSSVPLVNVLKASMKSRTCLRALHLHIDMHTILWKGIYKEKESQMKMQTINKRAIAKKQKVEQKE